MDQDNVGDDTPIIDGNEPDLLRILAKPLFGRFIDAAECSKIYSLRNLTGKLPPLFTFFRQIEDSISKTS